MRRALLGFAATALALGALASPAIAQIGFSEFDVAFTGPKGETVTQAGSHPFAMSTTLHFQAGEGGSLEEAAKDILVSQVAGFAGNPTAVPRCPTADFLTGFPLDSGLSGKINVPSCADASAVGVVTVTITTGTVEVPVYGAIYNLEPPPGVAAKLGFYASGVPVTLELGVSETPPYNVIGGPTNLTQALELLGSAFTLWGTPADPAHDTLRGHCIAPASGASLGSCHAAIAEVPFLTLPRACEGPLATSYAIDSWQHPGAKLSNDHPDLSDPNWVRGAVQTHETAGNPVGMTGCAQLGFAPEISAQPTSKAATSPSGLDFSLDTENEGLANPDGLSNADVDKAVVTLPRGFSTNPALAEGLNVCSEAQFAAETPYSAPGEGPNFAPPGVACPEAAKIGSVEVETPILEGKLLKGSLFIATPYENPFNSLIAIYMVIKDPELGIVVKVPLRVSADPVTGQLTTFAEDLPPFPVSHFRLHFREGTRSPLATPSACGTYDGLNGDPEPVRATLYPSSGGAPVRTSSAFSIISGPEGNACPNGGLPPFHPGLIAGTLNNAAGHFSPFNLRLSRTDSEQEITHFSIKLPPGITGKLAGIPYCPDAAIAQAIARTGPHGGQEELNSPSCPASSEVGHTLAGAGVGSSLAYAPGKVYLAGPYHGSNLSIVAITAGVVGPFDLGTVVVRQALKIDPETAEVFIDSTGSDPIPHIIKGIPVHLRDIRAYVDRPNFVLNPTDCTRTSTASTLLGSGLDFGSEADDRPVTVSTPFQAADCAALPFKPKLALSLKGGTRRGDYPAFKATLAMNGIGEAGIARAQVTLPKSEFIANAHFNTICTRVQFKAGQGNGTSCPAGSVYGRARATTPILGEPLTGPVFLRSSEHQLPDLVVALHNSQVDFDLVGHVDSVKGKLRNTFEAAPDAPVSSFVLEMQGGKKGLFENSTNLCAGTRRALSAFTGQNGKVWDTKPVMRVKCPKGRTAKHKRAAHRRR